MKLSQAILLGDTLRQRNGGVWYVGTDLESQCGCALGGAILADGHNAAISAGVSTITRHWPWLTSFHIVEISTRFKSVCDGTQTIEQHE